MLGCALVRKKTAGLRMWEIEKTEYENVEIRTIAPWEEDIREAGVKDGPRTDLHREKLMETQSKGSICDPDRTHAPRHKNGTQAW